MKKKKEAEVEQELPPHEIKGYIIDHPAISIQPHDSIYEQWINKEEPDKSKLKLTVASTLSIHIGEKVFNKEISNTVLLSDEPELYFLLVQIAEMNERNGLTLKNKEIEDTIESPR